MRRRRTARLRLTLWYGGLVFVTGVCLLLLNFFLVERSLTNDAERLRTAVQRRVAEQAVVEPSAGQPFQGFLRELDQLSGPAFTTAQASLVTEALSRLMLQSALALPVVTLFSLGVGWVMAGRVLRPLSEITATAQRLSEANLHERIRLAGPDDELKELADTFDAMLGRLDAAFSAQRDFVSNASHELRTPLAIIRAELDVTLSDPSAGAEDLRAMGETIRTATLRSEQLVDSLLALAQTERPAQARERIDLDLVARAALDAGATSAQLAELRLSADLRPASVVGDRALIERLVENLVENATRHNLPSGWVRLATGRRGGMSLLQVSNSGQSLTAEQMDQLFERFTRLDRSRARSTGGFGLGMPIVKAVAAAHGGTVEARPLNGGGLAVTVLIPSEPAAGAL